MYYGEGTRSGPDFALLAEAIFAAQNAKVETRHSQQQPQPKICPRCGENLSCTPKAEYCSSCKGLWNIMPGKLPASA